MMKFYSQKRLFAAVDKPLLRNIEAYINKALPQLLQLNLQKGLENPLADYITVTLHRQHYAEFLRSIDNYSYDQFDEGIQKVSIELAIDNKFNFHGQKTIVLIVTFDRTDDTCDFSVALLDSDAKRKIPIIEREVLMLLQRGKKPAITARLKNSILID